MFNVQCHQLQSTGQIYHQNIWRVVGYLQYCPLGLYPCLSSLMTGFFIIGDFSTWLSSALWWTVKILKCCLYEAIIYLITIENQKSLLMSTRRFSLDEDFCLKIECSNNEDKNGHEKCIFLLFFFIFYFFNTFFLLLHARSMKQPCLIKYFLLKIEKEKYRSLKGHYFIEQIDIFFFF